MKRNFLALVAVVALSLISTSSRAFAVPVQTADEDRVWCRQAEGKLTKNIKLPGGFDEKQAGNLKANIQFHLSKDGLATKVRATRENSADLSTDKTADKATAKTADKATDKITAKATAKDKETGKATKAEATASEKKLADVETALIAAVKASQPLSPIPQSFTKSGKDITFTYEPNGAQRVQVSVNQ